MARERKTTALAPSRMITPFWDNVLVKKVPDEQVSEGGIIMPEVGPDGKRNFHCEVLAIGPKAVDDCKAGGVVVGDIILTGRWHCEMVLIGGTVHGVIKPSGIIGKVVN